MTGVDWGNGPVPCAGGCGRRLRPRASAPTGEWEGTVRHRARGLCQACYDRERRSDPASFRFVWRWKMLPDVPVVHQEQEAVADLMDCLREIGCVLVSRPVRSRLVHGSEPFLVLRCRVRRWVPVERAALTQSGARAAGGGE